MIILRKVIATCSLLDLHRPYFELREGELQETRLSPTRHALRRLSLLYAWFDAQLQWRWSEANRNPELAAEKPRRWQLELFEHHTEKLGLEFSSNLYSLVPAERQPEAIRAGWEVTRKLLERLAQTLQARSTPLVAVVIPSVNTLDPDGLAVRAKVLQQLEPNHGTSNTERMLRELGVPTLSVRRRILDSGRRPDDYFYPHATADKHLNFFGHYYVASWILDELRLLDLTERPQPLDPLEAATGPGS